MGLSIRPADGSSVAAAALLAIMLSGAEVRAAEPTVRGWTPHEAGLLLDRSFSSHADCDRALGDARQREGDGKKADHIDYRRLFAHGRCEQRRSGYGIRMHWRPHAGDARRETRQKGDASMERPPDMRQ
jgi:hypothetical protein